VRRFGADGLPADASATSVASGVGDQRAPTVAAGPAGWLVAWQDGRSIFGWDVYGAFVNAGGARVAAAFAVGDAPNDQTEPRAAADGARYLVAWRAAVGGCGRDAGCDPDLDPFCELTCDADPSLVDVHARWVDPARGPDGASFAVVGAGGAQLRPTVAAGDGGFLVAWEDRRGADADIRAASLASGASAPGAEVIVSSAPGDQRTPSLAFGGGLFQLAWQDARVGGGDIYVARVLPSGAVLDPTGLPVATESSPESTPALALSGGGAGLVAYARFDGSHPYGTDRVRARMVSFGGEVGATCSTAGECGTGLCAGGLCCPAACDDGDPCTDDGCAAGPCTHVRRDTPACATPDTSAPDAGEQDGAPVPADATPTPDASVPLPRRGADARCERPLPRRGDTRGRGCTPDPRRLRAPQRRGRRDRRRRRNAGRRRASAGRLHARRRQRPRARRRQRPAPDDASVPAPDAASDARRQRPGAPRRQS
jgi:hypothetical protein